MMLAYFVQETYGDNDVGRPRWTRVVVPSRPLAVAGPLWSLTRSLKLEA